MIELPEARLLAEQITAMLAGKEITDVTVNFTPHKFAFFYQDPLEYPGRLEGKKITSACNRGGLLEIHAGIMRIVLSDGANVKYLPPGSKLPARHQLLIGFDDQSCLTVSVQMYGMLWCFPEGEMTHAYYLAGKKRANAFSPGFTEDYFLELASGKEVQNKSVKALLATEQRIPGLGNGVLQDILYQAGIHPKRKVESLAPEEKQTLFRKIVLTNRVMYESGGRDSEKDLFGIAGKYITQLSRNTLHRPCNRCGSLIQKENYMGGSIYFCPECQPLDFK